MARPSRPTRGEHDRDGEEPAAPQEETRTGTPHRRFIASHLLSIYPEGEKRTQALEQFSTALQRTLLANVNVVAAAGGDDGKRGTTQRRVVVFDADPEEVAAKASELTPDTVIEPELPRVPALAYPAALLPTPGLAATTPGTGATLALTLDGASGEKVAGAKVIVRFSGVQNPTLSIVAGGISTAQGTVAVSYDPAQWMPTLAAVEPDGKYWTAVVGTPRSGQTIQLQELPVNGPFGWWHLLSGANAYNPAAGRGIKVGVIDSGVGPHPNLRHAVPIGAFLDGAFLPGADEGRDVQTHGTHVSGIIGARPPDNSNAFSGIAPGAELFVARIFTATGGGNQGDVANAIDALSNQYGADIINMSLTGAPSAIEHDAVIMAFQRGTVCVCAAGNQNGSPVGYPAAYPEAVAVSALGLIDTAPAGTMPALNAPTQPDRYGMAGIFLASFSNLGRQVLCASPGNGIISTIPTTPQLPAPYADMSGTSMASPLAAGVLADLLSRTPGYTQSARTAARADMARLLLAQHALSVNLNPLYQGRGMARAV